MSSSLIVNVVWDSSENQKLVSIQSPFKSLKMPMLTKAENYLLSKFFVYSHKSKNDSKWTWEVLLKMKKSLIQVSGMFVDHFYECNNFDSLENIWLQDLESNEALLLFNFWRPDALI